MKFLKSFGTGFLYAFIAIGALPFLLVQIIVDCFS